MSAPPESGRGTTPQIFLTSTLCAPLIVFSPVLIKDALNGDVGDFSIAVGAFGIGGLLGAAGLLGVAPDRDRRGLTSWFAVCYGLLVVLIAVNPWNWVLPALLVIAGLSMSVSNTSANTLLQSTASPSLRGQTVSLYMLAMRGGVSIGSLATGVSVSLLGVRQALLINGILAVVAQLWVLRAWSRPPPRPAAPRKKGPSRPH